MSEDHAGITKAAATLGMRWAERAFSGEVSGFMATALRVEGGITRAQLAALLGIAIEDAMLHVLSGRRR